MAVARDIVLQPGVPDVELASAVPAVDEAPAKRIAVLGRAVRACRDVVAHHSGRLRALPINVAFVRINFPTDCRLGRKAHNSGALPRGQRL
jgi:hypothetical protein